jgi:purine-binding chemotaxis protein CheW
MQNDNSREAGGADGSGTLKVLTFSLGTEVYGVDILRLKEIRGWSPVTRLPHSPPCVLGVLNLRGVVVPIIDLRLRFGLQAAQFTAVTVVIVLALRSASGVREFGIVVDQVLDVVDIPADRIKPTPETHGTAAGEFIEGIATLGEQMLILLNAESLVFREQAPTGLSDQAA